MTDNPFTPPSSRVADLPGVDQPPLRRGWALTAYLIFAGCMSLFSIAFYAGLTGISPSAVAPVWLARVLLAASIVRLVSIVAIWKLRRWGVVLCIALTLALIPLTFSIAKGASMFSLIGVALLASLVREKWPQMR